MEQRAIRLSNLRDLWQGGQHASLVVGGHHGHQQGLIVDCITKTLKVNDALMIHWDKDHIGALCGKRAERLQDRRMFCGGANDPAPRRICTLEEALESEVVG